MTVPLVRVRTPCAGSKQTALLHVLKAVILLLWTVSLLFKESTTSSVLIISGIHAVYVLLEESHVSVLIIQRIMDCVLIIRRSNHTSASLLNHGPVSLLFKESMQYTYYSRNHTSVSLLFKESRTVLIIEGIMDCPGLQSSFKL